MIIGTNDEVIFYEVFSKSQFLDVNRQNWTMLTKVVENQPTCWGLG